MRLTKIISSTSPLLSAIHSIYMSSFPVEERRPWESLTRLIDSGIPFFSLFAALTDENVPVGFVSVWHLPEAMYIEHLAVSEAMRGSGVGGKILDEVVTTAADTPVVVEVELPEANAEAPRRIAFYERHGFTPISDFTYFQPPYAPGLPDVQLLLMTNRPLPDPKSFVIMLHTIVYNQ